MGVSIEYFEGKNQEECLSKYCHLWILNCQVTFFKILLLNYWNLEADYLKVTSASR